MNYFSTLVAFQYKHLHPHVRYTIRKKLILERKKKLYQHTHIYHLNIGKTYAREGEK